MAEAKAAIDKTKRERIVVDKRVTRACLMFSKSLEVIVKGKTIASETLCLLWYKCQIVGLLFDVAPCQS